MESMNDEKIVTLRYINETGADWELVEIDAPVSEVERLERGEIGEGIRTFEPRRFKGEEAKARILALLDEMIGSA
jgi:hypothetical protein